MITVEIVGLEDAQRAIRALGELGGREVTEPALVRAAQPIVAELRGRLEGHAVTGLTAEDITVSPSREARGRDDAAVLIGATTGKAGRAYILRFLEFGTSRMAARPVVRPTWDRWRDKVNGLIAQELGPSYDRAIRRLASLARSRRAA